LLENGADRTDAARALVAPKPVDAVFAAKARERARQPDQTYSSLGVAFLNAQAGILDGHRAIGAFASKQ
jgi:hypothetical protein